MEQEFSGGASLIHRLDPRVKVLSAAAFSVVAAVLTDSAALLAAAGAAITVILLARLPARLLLRRLAAVNIFLLFLWLTLPLTITGAASYRIGPLGMAPEGLLLALVLTIKSNAIVLSAIALLATNPPEEIGRALGRLRVPGKIVHILLFMLRYLTEIRREYGWMRTAMTMRSFTASTNLRTYTAYARLVGLLLVVSYEKAEAIHAAMLCRGFHGKFYVLDDSHLKHADIMFATAAAATILCVALLQWPIAAAP